MKYERLTAHSAKGLKLKKGKKFVELLSDKNLTLLALNRLAELEDKIESGKMIELPTIITFPDMHPILGKITTYQVIWLSKLLGIRHEKYANKSQAEARLKELQGE